ncbi:HEAT repeat domain-containing protein [Streptomyces zhihengii]
MDDGDLIAAVGRGDEAAVRALVAAAADPDTRTGDGLPVLCAAIAGFDAAVAGALVEAGADPDRELPDGTTPLLRAVDSGSPALVQAVLGPEPRLRLTEPARSRLLGLARRRYEEGPETGLRCATGLPGPALRTRMQDDEYDHVTELELGGRRVRAGHGAVLCHLEWAFRVLTPVAELVDRGVAGGDRLHVDWSAARWILSQRRSRQTWSEVAAYHRSPDPLRRLFAVDVLGWYRLTSLFHSFPHEQETGELLAAMAVGEDDPAVLSEVLRALSDSGGPEHEAIAVRHAGHPDAGVRCRVPDLLILWDDAPVTALSAPARAALLALARDGDGEVRAQAVAVLARRHDLSAEITSVLAGLLRDPDPDVVRAASESVATCPDRTPEVADALAALLDEDDVTLRLNAAHGLLLRDDPRIRDALERVRPFDRPEFEPHDHRVSALIQWSRDNGGAEDGTLRPQP